MKKNKNKTNKRNKTHTQQAVKEKAVIRVLNSLIITLKIIALPVYEVFVFLYYFQPNPFIDRVPSFLCMCPEGR